MCGLALTSVGCGVRDPLYCEEHADCRNSPGGPFCDKDGTYPASEGHGRTCIPCPLPEGCEPDGGLYDAAVDGAAGPDAYCAIETCDNIDNDCDGDVDEDLTLPCGSDVGDCVSGTQSCSSGGWGACVGEVPPAIEDCDGGDEDCDSSIDEGCACIDGATMTCGSDVGACVSGLQTCAGGTWGGCAGSIEPVTELCTGGADDDCDGMTDEGCPAQAVPIAPQFGAYTGSVFATTALRPTFRWALASGGTSYDLQVDDSCPVTGFESCAFPSPEATGTSIVGTTWQPPTALPVSLAAPVGRRYFWRLRACNGAGCSGWSGVRYVNVGRQQADVNGDGYADRIVGAQRQDNGATDEGNVFIYFGKPTWTIPSSVSSADTTIDNPQNQVNGRFGSTVAAVGDVDGDGFSDLAVGAPFQDDPEADEGSAYLYLGRATWTTFVGSADVTIDNPQDQPCGNLGGSICGGSDVNGDGYADLVVGARSQDTPEIDEGAAFLFFGRGTWPATIGTADLAFDNPMDQASSQFGMLGCDGDLNGDGLGDIVITASGMANPENDEGGAFIYFGHTTWAVPSTVEAADVIIDNPADQALGYLGVSLTTGGDLNGDGYNDLLLGAPQQNNLETDEGNVFMFFGKPSWPASVISADVTFDNPADQANSWFGVSASATADLNGDGLSDLLVGASVHDSPEVDEGAVFLYFGRLTWVPTITSASVTFDNPLDQASGFVGGAVGGASDANGDGLVDVLVGGGYLDNPEVDEGTSFMWFGTTTWPSNVTSADITFDNPADQPGGQFGYGLH